MMAILVLGIILILFSMASVFGFFSKSEWHAPLLELTAELKGGAWKKLQPETRRRGASLVIFFLVLFSIGETLVLRSPILQNYRNLILIVLGILLLWLLKGTYELIRAFYSRKTWLLNYLFSPYLFAWRRDHLSEYSDHEIAAAICRVCNIRDENLIQAHADLKSFLIALHQKTRPPIEHKKYPEVLEENISQAEQMIPI